MVGHHLSYATFGMFGLQQIIHLKTLLCSRRIRVIATRVLFRCSKLRKLTAAKRRKRAVHSFIDTYQRLFLVNKEEKEVLRTSMCEETRRVQWKFVERTFFSLLDTAIGSQRARVYNWFEKPFQGSI